MVGIAGATFLVLPTYTQQQSTMLRTPATYFLKAVCHLHLYDTYAPFCACKPWTLCQPDKIPTQRSCSLADSVAATTSIGSAFPALYAEVLSWPLFEDTSDLSDTITDVLQQEYGSNAVIDEAVVGQIGWVQRRINAAVHATTILRVNVVASSDS